MNAMEKRIAGYLAHRMPRADDVRVSDLARIHGGSSQETYRFQATWREDEADVEKRLILRREPPSGLVVAERDLEYTVYRSLANRGIPVPGAHFLELDSGWLERPFFIMDMMPGKPGHFYAAQDPYEGMAAQVVGAFWHTLGKLAAIDHHAIGLAGLRNGEHAGNFWQRELDYWERRLDESGQAPEPCTRGVIRRLRRDPPRETSKPAVTHGDYRAGNFLFTPDGAISAVLDWEMCHIGDPLEDVAWALDGMWPMSRYFPLEDGLGIWEAASGMTIDRDALDWWRLFATVKASAIWATAEASVRDGTSHEMVVAISAIRAGYFHRHEALMLMEQRGAMG
uniref:phosphotransferase family protein n=1 Tax=uncultured Sphingomonas sp. TaxID=158754 RepID=UPI0035C977EC